MGMFDVRGVVFQLLSSGLLMDGGLRFWGVWVVLGTLGFGRGCGCSAVLCVEGPVRGWDKKWDWGVWGKTNVPFGAPRWTMASRAETWVDAIELAKPALLR